MEQNKNLNDSKVLAREAARVLIEKKGIDVKMFCVEGHTSVTDYYVNATGRSGTHVLSLSDDVAETLSTYGREPLRIEGRTGNSWLLVDYGDVIVNVFDKQSRDFYNLDRLMPEDTLVSIQDIIEETNKKFEINIAKD